MLTQPAAKAMILRKANVLIIIISPAFLFLNLSIRADLLRKGRLKGLSKKQAKDWAYETACFDK